MALVCTKAGAQAPGSGNPYASSFLLHADRPLPVNTFLKHSEKPLKNRIIRGSLYATAYNTVIGLGLSLSSEQITQWYKKDKFTAGAIIDQYRSSFTTAPVIDQDLFIIDYLGHPYQGAVYYNCLRAQGGTAWQSAFFCAAHSTFWEYGWEGGIEQPSIQDLIVTPLGGILLGEAAHLLTIRMSRNGYRWYEKVIVCLLDPAWAVNNGFRTGRLSGYGE